MVDTNRVWGVEREKGEEGGRERGEDGGEGGERGWGEGGGVKG